MPLCLLYAIEQHALESTVEKCSWRKSFMNCRARTSNSWMVPRDGILISSLQLNLMPKQKEAFLMLHMGASSKIFGYKNSFESHFSCFDVKNINKLQIFNQSNSGHVPCLRSQVTKRSLEGSFAKSKLWVCILTSSISLISSTFDIASQKECPRFWSMAKWIFYYHPYLQWIPPIPTMQSSGRLDLPCISLAGWIRLRWNTQFFQTWLIDQKYLKWRCHVLKLTFNGFEARFRVVVCVQTLQFRLVLQVFESEREVRKEYQTLIKGTIKLSWPSQSRRCLKCTNLLGHIFKKGRTTETKKKGYEPFLAWHLLSELTGSSPWRQERLMRLVNQEIRWEVFFCQFEPPKFPGAAALNNQEETSCKQQSRQRTKAFAL